MPLAALIISADETGLVADALPALMPITGQTLIEYQARIARTCGCTHIVVLVDQLPAALVEAFDRLRASGIDVDIARDCRDAADRVHPDEQLLLMTPGVVITQRALWTLIRVAKPALLTVPVNLATPQFERIDGAGSWTGLALLNGQILRQTVASLGDWSLGSTLLRSSLQSGAQRVILDNITELATVATVAQAKAFSRVLIAQASDGADDGIERWLARPLARRIAPYFIARNFPFELQSILPLAALGISVMLALMGWFIGGFAMIMIATVAQDVVQIAGDATARAPRSTRIFQLSKLPTLSAMLLAVACGIAPPNAAWLPVVLALWASSALLLYRRSGEVGKPWSPTSESGAVIMIIALLANQPIFGLAVIILHCLADQTWSRFFND